MNSITPPVDTQKALTLSSPYNGEDDITPFQGHEELERKLLTAGIWQHCCRAPVESTGGKKYFRKDTICSHFTTVSSGGSHIGRIWSSHDLSIVVNDQYQN